MSDDRGFLKIERSDSEYRPAGERIQDWREIYTAGEGLKEQASRCMDCGVPFCQSSSGCPVDNLIPEWNLLVSQDRWKDALNRLQLTNNFPEFTGRLCPAPCESACVLGVNSDPVTIKEIEWKIIDRGFEEGWIAPAPIASATGFSVAIVGSGPAGLAAAQQLVRKGHSVTVFEKANQLGGLLRYGIPDFKFEKWRIDRRLKQLSDEGVRFVTATAIGTDKSLRSLMEDFDAVCLALGAEQPRDLDVPGRNLQGIHFAMDYLVQQNQALEEATPSTPTTMPKHTPKINAKGKNVIILGGGDTGSDCLGTALRQGAKSVLQFEIMPKPPVQRSEMTPWPQWPMQLRSSHAHEEGGSREWSLATTRFDGVTGDEAQKNQIGKLIAERVSFQNGKFEKVQSEQTISEIEFPVDLVILALGFTGPTLAPFLKEYPLAQDSRGNLATDSQLMTSVPGIFAAGDVRRGASLIVWAIAEGRKMAESVDRYVRSCAGDKAYHRIGTQTANSP
jgi:glutamate synthase (NADPH/NADH) small chain